VVLAVSLIAGENIALDTTAQDVLAKELEDYDYDFWGGPEVSLTPEKMVSIKKDLESVYGVDEVLPLHHLTSGFEIHNSSTIIPPTYGYYKKIVEVNVPVNGTLWLNTTLDQIPRETNKLYGYVYSAHDGSVIEGLIIEAFEMIEATWYEGYYNSTITDSNGSYELFLPPSGFEIRVNEGDVLYYIQEINITSEVPEKQLDFYIQNVESSSIEGYIIDPITGQPINETLPVYLWNYTIFHSNSTISENGYYSMNTIPGNLSVIGFSYWRSLFTNTELVSVPSNTSVKLNITLQQEPEENVIFKGHIYDDLTGNPIDEVRIRVQSLDIPYSNNIREDSNLFGYFQFNITSGNVSIYIGKDGYLPQRIEVFNSKDNVLEKDFHLIPQTSSIKGYIHTIYGGEIQNGYVWSNREGLISHSNNFGYFEAKVSYGNHTLTIDSEASNVPYQHDEFNYDIYGFTEPLKNSRLFSEIAPNNFKAGSMDIKEGEIVITETISSQYNIGIGDEIYLLDRNGNDIKKWSYNVTGIATWETIDHYPNAPIPDLILSIFDLKQLISSLEDSHVLINEGTEIFVKIDRDRVIDPLSRDVTDFSLIKFASRINSISAINYGILLENIITTPLESYYNWYDGYRMEMLAYSVPVIAVGLYLGIVGIDLSLGQKRRVFGILKSRGASDKQIFFSLLFESMILGVIAGVIGLILGVFVSRTFLTIIPGSRNVASNVDFFKLNISPSSIIMAMMLAVFLMIFAAIKPAKRISRASTIESVHRFSVEGQKKDYKPTLDIILVSFAILAYIVVAEVNLNQLDPARYGIIVVILLVILFIVSIIWLPFSPFILMFSTTRLLTRGTNKVYMFFSKAVKPFAGELWYVIHKNMTRNPKRVSMVSIIIALALGFGIFMTTMIGTTMHGEELEAKAWIGSDIFVSTYLDDETFFNDLKNIDGVSDVVPVYPVYGNLLEADEYNERIITLFDSKEYRDHVDVDDYFFVKGNPKDALADLSDGNSVILGEGIAQKYSMDMGSLVKVSDLSDSKGWDPQGNDLELKTNIFKVVGIVRALPGLEIFSDHTQTIWGEGIYIDFSALKTPVSPTNGGWVFLVDVEKGVDSKIVENAIEENFSTKSIEIQNLDSTLDDLQNEMPSNSILYIMLVNVSFMIIIITVGLGLILFIAISERKNEFATMMARGAEAKQIAVLILGEALSITLVGAVVGISTGLFTAYTFNKMLSSNTPFGTSGNTLSERPLIIPWYGVLVIILALVSLIITSIIAAHRAKKIKLHQALRARGG
jgi:ABC-type lipoprotein release transport system permease subunit